MIASPFAPGTIARPWAAVALAVGGMLGDGATGFVQTSRAGSAACCGQRMEQPCG